MVSSTQWRSHAVSSGPAIKAMVECQRIGPVAAISRLGPLFPERNHLYPREDVAQGFGVRVECCTALLGERDRRSRGWTVAGLLSADVSGVLKFAEVGDEVAGGQADHVLQAGEGERVAVGERGPRHDDPPPRRGGGPPGERARGPG